MTITDKYGQATVSVCQKALDAIQGLDDTIEIWRLRNFLENRITQAIKELEQTKTDFANKLEGKCFRIEFNQNHVVLFKIDKVAVFEQDGEVDAVIYGEKIVSYHNNIGYYRLDGGNYQLYSEFKYANEQHKEYANEKFDIIARRLNSVSF